MYFLLEYRFIFAENPGCASKYSLCSTRKKHAGHCTRKNSCCVRSFRFAISTLSSSLKHLDLLVNVRIVLIAFWPKHIFIVGRQTICRLSIARQSHFIYSIHNSRVICIYSTIFSKAISCSFLCRTGVVLRYNVSMPGDTLNFAAMCLRHHSWRSTTEIVFVWWLTVLLRCIVMI